MNRAAFGTLTLICVAALGCQTAGEEFELGEQSREIANGTLDNGDPSTGFLVMGAEIDGQLQQVGTCSLTVITNDLNVRTSYAAITARHCVRIESEDGPLAVGTELSAENLFVFFEQTPGVQDAPYLVTDVEFSPNADIAMLKLAEPAPSEATLINSAALESFVGNDVRIAGYGISSLNGVDAGIKRSGVSELLSVATPAVALEGAPQTLIDGVGEAGATLFMGNAENGEVRSNMCPGDSGGSTYMDIAGEQVLAGVNSIIITPQVDGSPDCGDPSLIGVSVRVDKYNDFINSFISRTDAVPGSLGIGNADSVSSSSAGEGGQAVVAGCSTTGTKGGPNWLGSFITLLALGALLRRFSILHLQ